MYVTTKKNKDGTKRYYWYKSVRRGKDVIAEYIRPATAAEAEEYFKSKKIPACSTSSGESA